MRDRSGGIVIWLWGDNRATVAIEDSRLFLIKENGGRWYVTSHSSYLESQLARKVFMTRDGAIIACTLVLLDEI